MIDVWLLLNTNLCKKTSKFINGCKANNDTHKTAKIVLTFNIYGAYMIAIDLRNSPMALHANSCLISMDCYISADSFEIHSKAQGLCSILQKYQAYVKGLFCSRRKTLIEASYVGLATQSWYTNYCWCSTTVTGRVERWHNRTALIKLILYSQLGYSQCCIGEIV